VLSSRCDRSVERERAPRTDAVSGDWDRVVNALDAPLRGTRIEPGCNAPVARKRRGRGPRVIGDRA